MGGTNILKKIIIYQPSRFKPAQAEILAAADIFFSASRRRRFSNGSHVCAIAHSHNKRNFLTGRFRCLFRYRRHLALSSIFAKVPQCRTPKQKLLCYKTTTISSFSQSFVSNKLGFVNQ